jgi:aminoglycoside phosphotransferase (APT) family kinase protein
LPVVPPIRTSDGQLMAPTYGVFPYKHCAPAPDDPVLLAGVLRQVHAVTHVALPPASMDEWCIEFLRAHLGHPWIADRREELVAAVDRLEAVIDLGRRTDAPHVLVHNDLYGDNLLVDETGDVVAILDWDHACLAPREHDLWMAADEERASLLLDAYGARDLDPTHLEYALLARALRDLAARVRDEADRPGIDQWGFRRLARLDDVLGQIR